ncbi:MAG TPA: hypothetical protein VNH11_12600 [Pirellulales bacterium]|nr:hypothetical protein [Pirellulales bacterium]
MLYRRLSFVALLLAGSAVQAEESAKPDANQSALFKQIDANGDNQISEDEVPQDKRRLFARLLRRGDANADGKLSQEEFTKAIADERPQAPAAGPGGDGGDRFRQFLEADPAEAFKRLDANGDGKIELSEVPEQGQGRLAQFLEYYDANRDKALSLDEFRKGHEILRAQAGIGQPPRPAMPGGLLKVLDTNGDGALSKEEIAAAADSLRKLDRDSDGSLSPRELQAVLPRPPGQSAPAPSGEKRPDGNPRPEAARLLERLRSMDANGDGKWSESELPPFLRPRFSKIDANGDGLVDGDELKQALASLRQPQQ